MRIFALSLFVLLDGQAYAEDIVRSFEQKTGLRSGGDYFTFPEKSDCPEGRLSIERDGNSAVLIRLGANILADGVSDAPYPPERERNCTINHSTDKIKFGLIDTLKTMDCKNTKELRFASWHTVIKPDAKGFSYSLTFANGKNRYCYMQLRSKKNSHNQFN